MIGDRSSEEILNVFQVFFQATFKETYKAGKYLDLVSTYNESLVS